MYFTIPGLEFPNIEYFFGTKKLAYHKADKKKSIERIEQELSLKKLNILDQKHSDKIFFVSAEFDCNQEGDALITSLPNNAIGVVTADCLPLLLCDNNKKIVAAAHLGWRGALQNLAIKTVIQMNNNGARDIIAMIGPCIRQVSYEVDHNFYLTFLRKNPGNNKFFVPSKNENHYMFDLPGLVKNSLIEVGITKIYDLGYNTYTEEENFFSFRRTTHNPLSSMANIISIIQIRHA